VRPQKQNGIQGPHMQFGLLFLILLDQFHLIDFFKKIYYNIYTIKKEINGGYQNEFCEQGY